MRSPFVLFATFVLVFGLAGGSAYAGPADQSSSDVIKAVFVHYPRSAAAPIKGGGSSTSTNTCPNPSTCTDNKWGGQKWSSSSIPPYVLNASGSALADATVAGAVSAAFGAWIAPTVTSTTPLSISRTTGTTGTRDCSTAGTIQNGNQICWRDLTIDFPNAIAVTFVWYNRFTKEIVEADTVFNNGPGFTWSYTAPTTCDTSTYGCNPSGASGSYDVRDIGTHEFGHFLAFFGDLYSPKDSELTMYGFGATGEAKKDSLGRGDCLGITRAYGGTCP